MTNDEGFRFLTKPLTQDKVDSFLKEYLPDNVRPAMVARKIILVDIREYGLEEWAGALSAATMHSSFIVWG